MEYQADPDVQGQPHEVDIREWEEGTVNALLRSLGFPYYEQQIKEHGITGDILIHLDHEALKDVGIHSVGQRLSILKAVYGYKLRDEIPIEQGHWVPPTEDMDEAMSMSPTGSMSSRHVFDLLGERDERLRALELEVRRLSDALSACREDMQVISKALYNKEPPSHYNRPKAQRSPVIANFPINQTSAMSEAQRIAMQQAAKAGPSTAQFVSTVSGLHSSPADSPAASPAGITFQNYETLADTNPSTSTVVNLQSSDGSVSSSASQMPHTPAGLSNSTTSPASPGPSSPANFSPRNPAGATGLTRSNTISGDTSRTGQASDALIPAIRPSTSSSASPSTSSVDHPYKSFKVTLEDPCYKVLPAALKKYKINDDWREYALFICFGGGSTERCLSYDEKPLLLFQKLKDAQQNPVFMLRHIKDIKSPIQVATAKHVARREKRAKEKEVLSSDTRTAKILKETGDLGADGGLTTPTLASPEKDKEDGVIDCPHPMPLSSPGSRQLKGYCISIYPYLAEREDEFDVAVGDSFVIVNKAKGWWTVYRDMRQPGAAEPEQDLAANSGWVPAGCLLETSVAPLSLAAPSSSSDPESGKQKGAAHVPIKPSLIVSVSTPGLALMDFKAGGVDELRLVKGQVMRVYKRYNHWSYAIKEDTGERGWAPSWYVGKVNNREKAQPQIDSPSQSSPATPLDDNASAVSSAAASLSAIPRSNSSKILPPVNTI